MPSFISTFLALATIWGPQVSPSPSPKVERRQDDEAILELCMLSFFEKAEWNQNWFSGNLALLSPDWASSTRANFAYELEETIKSCSECRKGRIAAERLRSLKDSIRQDGKAFIPETGRPLKDLRLDDRIIVGPLGEPGSFMPGYIKAKNHKGVEGILRVSARATLPGYSRDGMFACLTLGCPEGNHGAHVIFIVERTYKGWRLVHAEPFFHF